MAGDQDQAKGNTEIEGQNELRCPTRPVERRNPLTAQAVIA